MVKRRKQTKSKSKRQRLKGRGRKQAGAKKANAKKTVAVKRVAKKAASKKAASKKAVSKKAVSKKAAYKKAASKKAASKKAVSKIATSREPKKSQGSADRQSDAAKERPGVMSSGNEKTQRKRYYLTTAIAYPNGPPHIGYAYEVMATDAIARFMRLDGYDVFFLTGTDEHGIKMLQTANKEQLTPQQLVERNAPRF